MRYILGIIATVAICGGAFGQSFTDVNSHAYWGKTEIPKLTAAIDANFALVEAGADVSYAALTVTESLTAISTNGATTNVIVTVDGVVDGETLADDSVDDDAIDFTDVTGADLTLTDCGTVTSSGVVTGTELAITEGTWDVVNTTQLVFIASGVTNVIDADITN